MWRSYLTVIAQQIPQALHVLDRFHIMQNMNKAIDEVRREEVARLKRDGYEPVLKHSRWCLLKRPENLTDNQATRLADLMTYNLKSVRAQLLREEFQRFWEYASDYVIHLDPWWNPAVEDQASDRAHRIGQTRLVTVYRLVAKDTIEEQILKLHAAKRDLVAGILDGTDQAAKLSTKELIDLITLGSRRT